MKYVWSLGAIGVLSGAAALIISGLPLPRFSGAVSTERKRDFDWVQPRLKRQRLAFMIKE